LSAQEIVRRPAVAGMFYDDSPVALRKNIDAFLAQVQNSPFHGTLKGIVAPHAGYVYSGLTAAHAYKLLEGKQYDCVILVGPSHREYFDGISLYSGDAYETPLGRVSIHKELRSALAKESKTIVVSNAGHRSEHSLEVQLPFLQRVLGEFSFVPIIMGEQRSFPLPSFQRSSFTGQASYS
jgi:AmmeMemoRadiSam system protein B